MPEYLPAYASESLRRFLAAWKEDFRLLHLSMRGIGMLTGMPGIFEALIETDEAKDGDSAKEKLKKDLVEAKDEGKLAAEECAKGFPLLHAHTLVATWGAFEVAIEDTLVKILLNEPKLLKNQAFTKVKIPLAEFQASDEEGRIRYLLNEITRNQGPGRKQGVDMFESLLDFLALSGAVQEDLKKTIWEMQHVRNVIVHRASCADKRLLEGCPWLNLKIGEKVIVSHDALGRYGAALCQYALNIAHRLCERYGVDPQARIRAFNEQREKEGSLSTCEDF